MVQGAPETSFKHEMFPYGLLNQLVTRVACSTVTQKGKGYTLMSKFHELHLCTIVD